MGNHYTEWLEKDQIDKTAQIATLRAELDVLKEIVALASTTCGRNNCNCPGSKPIKDLINAYLNSHGKEIPANVTSR